MKHKPSRAKLLRQRQILLDKLGTWPPVLRATLRLHKNVCGNPHCRCKDPEKPLRHGPYHYLSHRYKNKTQTVFLTETKLRHARAWIENYRELIQTIYDLSEINFQLLRYHYDTLESGDEEEAPRPECAERSGQAAVGQGSQAAGQAKPPVDEEE